MNNPYDSNAPTDATETPGQARALGKPLPKFTAVMGLSPLGSIFFTVLPSHPTELLSKGSAVCHISIDLK